MDERITKYDHLYKMMAEGSDPEKMHIFGNAERHMFRVLVERNSALADEWLAMLEGVEYNNYLTEEEAKEVSEHIENQDGTMGYHWPCAVLFPAVESLGGVIEEKPFYNKYALAAVMNMIYSDHADSIAMDMGGKKASDISNEKMAMSCYRKAVEKLKDPDRPRFVGLNCLLTAHVRARRATFGPIFVEKCTFFNLFVAKCCNIQKKALPLYHQNQTTIDERRSSINSAQKI